MVRVRDQAGIMAWAVAWEAVRDVVSAEGLAEGLAEGSVEGLARDPDVAPGEAEAADSAGVKASRLLSNHLIDRAGSGRILCE